MAIPKDSPAVHFVSVEELLRCYGNHVFSEYTLPGLGTWVYNVTTAEALIAARPREPVKLHVSMMEAVTTQYTYDERHVSAVSPLDPGIALPLYVPWGNDVHLRPWSSNEGLILIDGIHRCVRAYRNSMFFFAYTLSPLEALECLRRAPSWPEVNARARALGLLPS
jgi:hypothetical protein